MKRMNRDDRRAAERKRKEMNRMIDGRTNGIIEGR